jgi:hypothetical protein
VATATRAPWYSARDRPVKGDSRRRPEGSARGGECGDLSAGRDPAVIRDYAQAVEAMGYTHILGIEPVTGVLILPQRQTALVAKPAAEVDVRSSGRLRLGIGVGWNPVEFEALGENIRNRGKRVEEQLEVMRRLWTRELTPPRTWRSSRSPRWAPSSPCDRTATTRTTGRCTSTPIG